MAYVICAVGAGGKTTFLINKAKKLLEQGHTVCLSTTTHIWNESLFKGEKYEKRFFLCGKKEGKKLIFPGDSEYEGICKDYDYVLLECDGSKGMPVKIPREFEPVIPDNVNEIVVVMGGFAIGRRLKDVCQNYEGFDVKGDSKDDIVVNEIVLKDIAEKYYIKPLSEAFFNAKINYYQSPNPLKRINDIKDKRVLLVLLASGFSKRFNENKLLYEKNGKKLYTYMLDALKEVYDFLNEKGIETKLLTVSQYKEILDFVECGLENKEASLGISSSIKIGTDYGAKKGYSDVAFFLADMPCLDGEEIKRFVIDYLYSKKDRGLMCANGICSNPGIMKLNKTNIEGVRSLRGEEGAMKVIRREDSNLFLYHVDGKKLRDIDTKNDLSLY